MEQAEMELGRRSRSEMKRDGKGSLVVCAAARAEGQTNGGKTRSVCSRAS